MRKSGSSRRPTLRFLPSGRLLLVLGFLLALLPRSAGAQGLDLSHLPPHPRIFLRDALLPALRAERAPGQRKYDMYREIKRRADNYISDRLIGSYLSILNEALVGAVEADTFYTNWAVRDLMEVTRHGGMGWEDIELSIAYDWLYNAMTEAQRDTIRSHMYDLYRSVSGQRTVYYNLEANEALARGIAGLACFGDGGTPEQDRLFQAQVDNCDGRMRGVREFAWPNGTATAKGGVLPARQFYFPDGGYYKGNHYGQKDLVALCEYLYVFDDLGLGSHWDLCGSYLDAQPEYYLRLRRPDNYSSRIMMGQAFRWDIRGLESMAILASKRANPYAAWILNNFEFLYSQSGGHIWYFLYTLYRPDRPASAPTNLSLYKFYGEQGGGPNSTGSWHERVVTRTGWNWGKDVDDVYFMLTAGDYFGDYYNWFEPTFEIYYRGALAVRSGYYASGPQNVNYYSSAVSCNSVVAFDSTQSQPRDRWGTDNLYDDDRGGPGRPVSIGDVRDHREKFDVSEIEDFHLVLDQVDGQPCYYARARINPQAAFCYSGGPNRIQKLVREFFWTGRHFFIRDHVQLAPGKAAPKKLRWLLHTIEKPVMSTARSYAVVPEHVEVFPRGTYSAVRSGGGYDGKITVLPLLPENAVLRRVGGAGYECWVDAGWTSGTNYPAPDPAKYSNEYEIGQWRVETIAPGAVNEMDFLHYIYVSRPGETEPSTPVVSDPVGASRTIRFAGGHTFTFPGSAAGAGGASMRFRNSSELRLVPGAPIIGRVVSFLSAMSFAPDRSCDARSGGDQ